MATKGETFVATKGETLVATKGETLVATKGGKGVRRRRIAPTAALCTLALGAAACGGGSKSASSPAHQGTGGAKAAIERAWKGFFDGSSSVNTKESFVENAYLFSNLVSAQSSSALAKSVSVRVEQVSDITATHAKVTYRLEADGKPLLPHPQQGVAVKIRGTWKVSAATVCALVKIEGARTIACPVGTAGGSGTS